jgi:hypothetical protein
MAMDASFTNNVMSLVAPIMGCNLEERWARPWIIVAFARWAYYERILYLHGFLGITTNHKQCNEYVLVKISGLVRSCIREVHV